MKALLFLLALLPLPALAECRGQDLMAALPPAAIEAPFARGNLWQARKDQARLLLVGTYHLDDPRFDAIAAELATPLQSAAQLLVELSPADEAALKAYLASHPEEMFDQKGPSLRDRLGPQDWQALAQALQARGTPSAAVLKMRPWLVASMLEVPACLMGAQADRGLDRRLSALATAQGLPIRSLEPFDTAFRIFAALTEADQLEMIRQALATEPRAEDMATTLTEAYFRGESLAFVAFNRDYVIRTLGLPEAKVDAQMKAMFDALLTRRNRAWIPVIEAEAARGPLVVAFGALHLGGEAGVLNLLAQSGWTVTPFAPGEAWP